jgi:exodeoxyribonuclease-3
MKIVSWNVNSIRARYDRVLNWLQFNEPDVLCLQELKCVETEFPYDEISSLGYTAAVYGQKTYNGVAIISFDEPEDVVCGLDDGVDDPQARLIAATIDGVRVVNAYVPNGGEVGSDKWEYKLRWYDRLRGYFDRRCDAGQDLALCGDFNVAPLDQDVARPKQWGDSVLCVPRIRESLQKVVDWGLVDTFRLHNDGGGLYSWWDYRKGGFQYGNGLRIDMVYATASLAGTCTACTVDKEERKGEKPSDHAPVVAEFDR